MFSVSASGQYRTEKNLREWNFSRDKRSWEEVRIPHDWAISGPFDKKWDLQYVAIEQNGETEKSEKSGRSGALPWIGDGYYRTTVEIGDTTLMHELVFDGAMSEPVVYVNGRLAGGWAYGYNAFRIKNAVWRKGRNEIMVHLRNLEESSRWYPGAGLYRPVRLVSYDRQHFDVWGTFVRTVGINGSRATLQIRQKVENVIPGLSARILVYSPSGECIYSKVTEMDADGNICVTADIAHALLWSPEQPHLYTADALLYNGDKLVDKVSSKFGIRTVSVSKEKGFQLNGVTRKLQGVCLHHDLGPLGAAVNKAAIIRQVKLMKDMGADAIRTAHNMPSQIQMDVCDSLGMMVMAESFDMWVYPKCKNGYARFFNDWAERDLENLVLANRNHASLIMYSIGNEIPEQWSKEGRDICGRLQQVIHNLDGSRPVTQGMDNAEAALKSGFAQVLDVPGFNYRVYKYDRNIIQLPKGFLLGSETASTVSSRGVYKFPVEWSNRKTWTDGQCNGYDTEWCSWSNLPEEDFIAMEDAPYTIGQFVWTGFDYLGEPTPYDGYWPSRSSYFGIVDLAGLPKDRYYLYRSVWNRKDHTLHLLPHWNWEGHEGEKIPVFCYTDYPVAELFVNGVSQGKRSKDLSVEGEWKKGKPDTPEEAEARAHRYRLMWNDVVYTPGELKVVAYDANGNKADEKTVLTVGEAAALKLSADRTRLRADGDDLCFVTVSLVDKDGNEIPTADDNLTFEVTGAGHFRAACNGDATSLQPFTKPEMRLFSGKLVVVVQASDSPGTIILNVNDAAKGLSGSLSISVN